MGSNTAGKNTVKVVVPDAADVLRIYGQLAGKEQRSYSYARFTRPNGTFINDMSKESPANRRPSAAYPSLRPVPPSARLAPHGANPRSVDAGAVSAADSPNT